LLWEAAAAAEITSAVVAVQVKRKTDLYPLAPEHLIQ
jgi:hypothetical protein